jgi:dethiobiotin synthetase
MKQTFFITGTDTGVGKTVLTALLTRFLHERGINVAALKPVCSGGRADAHALHIAMNFRAPIAPLLSARKENRRVKLSQVLAHARMIQERFDILLVEGAGGLLSPLGENFDSRDLIEALHATPIIVAPNKLGVVSQVLLILEALPKNLKSRARIVLVSQPRPDASAKTNAKLFAKFATANIFLLPWLELKNVGNTALRRTLWVLVTA